MEVSVTMSSIKDIYDAEEMLKQTGCDAIMIGRAVLGNPWLIRELDFYLNKGVVIDKPNAHEKINMAIKHLKYLEKQKTEKLVLLEIRNHIAWYLKGLKDSNEIKNMVYHSSSINDIIKILNNYKKEF